MQAYGYMLKGKASHLSPDYIPSLIGTSPEAVEAGPEDMYFEMVEFDDRRIESIALTKWVNFDSLPLTGRDPIVIVKRPDGKGYYITVSELQDIAAFHQDDETFELLASIGL